MARRRRSTADALSMRVVLCDRVSNESEALERSGELRESQLRLAKVAAASRKVGRGLSTTSGDIWCRHNATFQLQASDARGVGCLLSHGVRQAVNAMASLNIAPASCKR